jgi:hypothetical protein
MMADCRAYGCTGDRVAAADLMTGQSTDRCALSGSGWLLVGIVGRVGGNGKAEKQSGQNDTSHRVFLRWGGLNAVRRKCFPGTAITVSVSSICLGACAGV